MLVTTAVGPRAELAPERDPSTTLSGAARERNRTAVTHNMINVVQQYTSVRAVSWSGKGNAGKFVILEVDEGLGISPQLAWDNEQDPDSFLDHPVSSESTFLSSCNRPCAIELREMACGWPCGMVRRLSARATMPVKRAIISKT